MDEVGRLIPSALAPRKMVRGEHPSCSHSLSPSSSQGSPSPPPPSPPRPAPYRSSRSYHRQLMSTGQGSVHSRPLLRTKFKIWIRLLVSIVALQIVTAPKPQRHLPVHLRYRSTTINPSRVTETQRVSSSSTASHQSTVNTTGFQPVGSQQTPPTVPASCRNNETFPTNSNTNLRYYTLKKYAILII